MLLHGAHALLEIELFEDGLFLCNVDVQVRREKISELLGIIDVQDH